MSPAVQAKLLRVVEDKEFERVGGTRTLRADVRILAASNLDLEAAVRRQELLEDLYYRLNVIPVDLPPLRRRGEDIPLLVEHFLTKICRDLGRPVKELEASVLDLFGAYAWPGNIRELESTIHRAVVLSGEGPLGVADFAWIALGVHGAESALRSSEPRGAKRPAVELGNGGYEEALESCDRRLIAEALDRSNGRIRETARLLGIARNTLRAKMKKYGMVLSRA
jgi:DNA-binding NtrC family response regulator